MQPTLIAALLSALFVATHIGTASTRTRAWMVRRPGENGFVALCLYAQPFWMEVHE